METQPGRVNSPGWRLISLPSIDEHSSKHTTSGGETFRPMLGNITVEPTAFATSVESPEITEILSLLDGRLISTKDFVNTRKYSELVIERNLIRDSLQTDQPRCVCSLCHTPVYLVSSQRKHFFFRHSSEDGSCPAQTRGSLSQEDIRALKYHGLRESVPHKETKDLLQRSLLADKSFSEETIAQEKHWKSTNDPKSYRRPDVQASLNGLRIAFEVQLSTTFLDVVSGRRMFYKREKGLLIWILRSFSPDYRRLTEDDILFSNNANIFVVDEETTQRSEKDGCFYLRCHYLRHGEESKEAVSIWKSEIVQFSSLKLDIDRQMAFFHDYEKEGNERRDCLLRERFFKFWKQVNPHFDYQNIEGLEEWAEIIAAFSEMGIELPTAPDGDGSFRIMVHSLLSAQYGKSVGWRHETLIQVAHNIAQNHTKHLFAFGLALKLSGHEQTILKQDTSGKWAQRCQRIRQEFQNKNPDYLPDTRWLDAMDFLFPAVGVRVRKFANNGKRQMG